MKRDIGKRLFVIVLLLTLTGCGDVVNYIFGTSGTPDIPNMPRYYKAEYNRVWNAALDTLDDLGFVIAQMDKSDGYITTDRKESTRLRQKISVRLIREGGAVKVKVGYYYEYLDSNVRSDGTSYDYWVEGHRSSGQTEKGIKDGIAERLGIRR